ncbi:1-phosphatidylinositol 4,5-bisphosphate phosphodiesterase gamma-1-like [Solea senegalensis]|uniref:1-phosphatidylinositol 4,5-bisphosphate phosphodiesterase gamma-1-like n=1 Tax=Solea senegalensis TaxID=28829 RepID=A0AAV6S6S7_SOLSE|nr:1-phosphatidylinositol 4,5-bisphosphate phosphodiesterase gamma-1-like [Solea senegalensis]
MTTQQAPATQSDSVISWKEIRLEKKRRRVQRSQLGESSTDGRRGRCWTSHQSGGSDPLGQQDQRGHADARNCVCADKPMQLNQASFTLRGGSGYVPQPDIMREDTFDPFEDRLQSSYSLNPVWVQEQFAFDIHNPTFSFLGVTVYEQLIFHTSHLNCTTRTSSSSSDSRIWIRIMILERFGRLHGFISK